ncbi:MAG: class I SAM-dependent methyltransferase, partial [Prevotellaceae bacterium]|nr:class I SAM-dependent methyltransferase [Prevotellaceae bacterium]
MLEKYCLEHSSPEPELLAELSRETHLRVIQPRMLSHWQQGLFLQMLAKITGAKNILEIGTFTGYSALCLAEALPANGELHSYDVDDEMLEIAQSFIDRSPRAKQIFLHHKNALQGAPTLGKTFDFIFIDGDKREYPGYYRMALNLLSSGGIIVADNVLWSGKILDTPAVGDKHTKALQEFNEMVKNDISVEKLILPLRDGLT